MKSYTVTQARKDIYQLVANVEKTHEPIQIVGKNNNAILISERDWDGIQETLYLMSIPGMTESILEGMNAPLEELSDKPFDDDDDEDDET